MRGLAATIASALSFGTPACRKVPLEADAGVIDFGSLHWFENEQTAYVFFSLAERENRLINPVWSLSYSERSSGGGVVDYEEQAIDFEQGVHRHALSSCGAGRLCGSYSFRASMPLSTATLGFRYDANASAGQSFILTPQNHAVGTTADAYSALVYGVFDSTNEHVAATVFNNFGSPGHEQVRAYGMTRRFQARGATARDATNAELEALQVSSVTPLLFPADICAGVATSGVTQAFEGEVSWLAGLVSKDDGARGACLEVDFLDRTGVLLGVAKAPAYARRNPELSNAEGLTLSTPLAEAARIQVMIKICDDDPAAGGMLDQDFLNYQRNLMEMADRPSDVCFRIGEEPAFRDALDLHLAQRLTAARAVSDPSRDIMFSVVLHERFATEFRAVQATVAASLYALIGQETSAVTPRLAGALVYGSSVDYQPNATQKQLVLWCPQNLLASFMDSSAAPLGTQNCTTLGATELDLQVINFVTPMGPFPSLTQYREYVDDFGDTGIAGSPKLTLQTIPQNVSTTVESGQRVTYFDNARYAIAPGEYARACTERFDDSVSSFRVKPAGEDAAFPGVSVNEVNSLWLSDDAAGEYRVGIAWEYPFVGGVRYTSTLSGTVASFVPFQRSAKAYEILGDAKWTAQSWDFGRFVQTCRRYCDNPFFDSAGAYQVNTTWRGLSQQACPAPAPPAWPGAAAEGT